MASWPRRINVQGMDIKGPLVRGIPTLTNDSAIVSGIPSGSSGSIHGIIKLYIYLTFYLTFFPAFTMTFYLTFLLTFYLTFFWHSIWREFWLSIWQWNLALNLERFWHSIWNAWVQHYSSICANYFISYLVYLVSDHRYAHLAPRLVTCGLENSTSPR